MYKLKILLISLFLIYPLAYAQNPEKVIEYDFGQIPQTEIAMRRYELKEEIINAVSLCECVKVKVAKKDKISLLEIEFNPTGYHGLVSEEVKLLDKDNNLITLRIKAFVK